MSWYEASVPRPFSSLLRDVRTLRRGFRWDGPRPRDWPERSEVVPARAADLSWARMEPVRSLRFLLQQGLLMPVTRVMTNPRVEGSEWVRDLERPAILASNHVSHTDTSLLLYALSQGTRERTVVAAAADYWYRRPWVGRFVALWLNTFPFSRTGGPQAVLSSSSQLLKSGWNLLVYPEGTRSVDGQLQEFKPGVGFLATETGAPVIPMHVSGSHRVMPKGQRVPLPAPVTVRVGKPIQPARGEGARAFTRRVEVAVRELSVGGDDEAITGSWIERWRATAPRGRRGE